MMGEQQRGGTSAGWQALGAAVPADHLLRRIDRLLDMRELRDALAPHYSRQGRPSIAPELLIRMALIGRLYGIASERRLCGEVRYNLAYRWFCRLPLGADVPHHSTFSKNRHGRFHDAGVFRLMFEQAVRRCVDAGLVACKDAAIDASFVAADASWRRKMRDRDLAVARLPRAVREWLADRVSAPSPFEPAELSRTDPAAAWAARKAGARFGYAMNVLVDTPGGVAMEVQASPARFAAEVDAGRAMLARAGDRFGYRPKRVAADTAYGSAASSPSCTTAVRRPTSPFWGAPSRRGASFPARRSATSARRTAMSAPRARSSLLERATPKPGFIRYSARAPDCRACHLKRRCTPGSSRAVTRSEHEDVRELVRAEMRTPMFQRSMRLRRGVERLFADAKGKRGLGRLHLRGLRGAEEEFLLGAAVANLVLLARPADRPARGRRELPPPLRANHMARVSRGRFEQAYYATIF